MRFAPLRALVVLVLLLVGLAWGVVGCGPMLFGHSPGDSPAFCVVVHNVDSVADVVTLSWWSGSTVVGSSSLSVPPGGSSTFVLGGVPDGLEVDTTAWPAASGGLPFGSPDYAGATILHVVYPTGFSWLERFP